MVTLAISTRSAENLATSVSMPTPTTRSARKAQIRARMVVATRRLMGGGVGKVTIWWVPVV